ncbi:MAG: hypothetical protein ABJZ55_25725 [Fuerstiella sp.]
MKSTGIDIRFGLQLAMVVAGASCLIVSPKTVWGQLSTYRHHSDSAQQSSGSAVQSLANQSVQLAGMMGDPGTSVSQTVAQVAVPGNPRPQFPPQNVVPRQPQRRPNSNLIPQADTGRASKYVLHETVVNDRRQLVVGQPAIFAFTQAPLRTYVPESGSGVVAIRYIDPNAPHRLSLEPLAAGQTTLTMWFADPNSPDGEDAVSWQIVVTDSQVCDFEQELAALEREINYTFTNSSIQLRYVGTRILVRGKAKDVEEASQILRIVSGSIPCDRNDTQEDFLGQLAASIRERSNRTDRDNNSTLNVLDTLRLERDSDTLAGLSAANRESSNTGVNQGQINNRVINMLEIAGVHQVMLKVTVAEINRSAARAIGADLQIGSVGDAVRFFTTLGPAAGAGSLVLNQTDFDLAISTLKQLNLARSLAEPTLTTLNGQPANFNVGGSFPVPIVTGQTATGLQGVDFQNFGVQLQFLPVVTDGDRVRLTLQASVSTRDEASAAMVGSTSVPGLNSRNFSNTVELREGQTLAVAGLIQSNLGGTSSRVPFLGDIPGIGRLFSNDGTSYDEQELVILVTPYLAGPIDEEQANQLALPGSDYFEPDDLEFFLKGRLTGHLAEDYRSPIRTDLQKMKAFRRCEQQLIIGQPGHSNGLMCPPAHQGSWTDHTRPPAYLPESPPLLPQPVQPTSPPPDNIPPLPDVSGRVSLNSAAFAGGVR